MSVVFPTTRVNLDFEWENDLPIEINYKLARLEGYLEDTEYLMERAMRILQKDMARKFEMEMDPDGQHWADLVKPEPNQIGILRRGSTNAEMYRAAISDEAWSASPVGVFFDSSVLPDYWIHHEQPDGGGHRIPQREFISPTGTAQDEIEVMAATWMDAGVEEITHGGSIFTGFTGVFNPKSGRFHDPSTGRFVKAPLI